MRLNSSQHGAAMLEFAVVGPLIMLIGMAILQYAMLFFAKGQINHAAFMAARAGSVQHASLSSVRAAYNRALVPLYGGGRDTAELAKALAKATADTGAHVQIELLNPTKEGFDDWSDPELKDSVGKGKRVIPHTGLAFKDLTTVKPSSHQSLSDANLIKIRITHGYAPKVPLIGAVYTKYLHMLDGGGNAFKTAQIRQGRIPVVAYATLRMQSDAIEPDNPVSSPGPGNPGQPSTPGAPQKPGESSNGCEGEACTSIEPATPSVALPEMASASCDAATDPGSCRPAGCAVGDPACDPACATNCCTE